MDVDVHLTQRQVQMQHAAREAGGGQLVLIGLLQRGGQQPGADVAPVDEEMLAVAVAAGGGGAGGVAAERDVVPRAGDLHHIQCHLPPQNGIDGAVELAVAGGDEHLLPVAEKTIAHGGVGQRLPLHHGVDLRALGGVALHELQPGGGVVEQVADDDGGALWAAGLLSADDGPALQPQADAGGPPSAGEQVDTADGGNGRQRLAAEAQRPDGRQIGFGLQFGGRVAQEGDLGVLAGPCRSRCRSRG